MRNVNAMRGIHLGIGYGFLISGFGMLIILSYAFGAMSKIPVSLEIPMVGFLIAGAILVK